MNMTRKAMTMRNSIRMLGAAFALVAVAIASPASNAAAPSAKAYATPDALFQAVAEAAKADDQGALTALFGAEAARITKSGNAVRDGAARERFAAAWAQKHAVTMKDATHAELVVGDNDWPFPVPAVKTAAGWTLDSAAGVREIVARRIGENEIDAIITVRAIADAQVDYASEPRVGNVNQYARKLMSGPGHRDGLYWKSVPGDPESPLGLLVANATREGYGKGTPYHGYRFRILTGQGPNAKGGARNYVVRGKMIGGFAILAYPAEYRDTGVMTFLVNQDGVVHQKDLGKHTAEVAPKVTRFDPDSTWKIVP